MTLTLNVFIILTSRCFLKICIIKIIIRCHWYLNIFKSDIFFFVKGVLTIINLAQLRPMLILWDNKVCSEREMHILIWRAKRCTCMLYYALIYEIFLVLDFLLPWNFFRPCLFDCIFSYPAGWVLKNLKA